jgi:hypothetical protein
MQKYFPDYPGLYACSLSAHGLGLTGAGLFASDSYAAGQIVVRLDWQRRTAGRILAWEECSETHQDRVTAIAPGWYFYPSTDHPFWFLNHSCHANIAYRDWGFYENGSIPLIALGDIRPDDELVIDYSTMTTSDDGEEEGVPWTMKCLCRAKNCRRILTDFVNLPRASQMSLLFIREPTSGVVPAFILNESQVLVDELRWRAPDLFERFQFVLAQQLNLSGRFRAEYMERPTDGGTPEAAY